MVIKESTETAFGTPIKGITIQMTFEEAKALERMLAMGFQYPPKIGMNTDFNAQDIGGKISSKIREITKS